MTKFRKKPIVIEAEQWFDGPFNDDVHLLSHEPDPVKESAYWPHVHTLEGELHVSPGDWIITGVRGEKYPIKDSIFKETYELVELDGSECDGS